MGYPPPRIIICTVEGDWFPWEHGRAPDPGDCPFDECDCTPVLYASTGEGVVERATVALIQEITRRSGIPTRVDLIVDEWYEVGRVTLSVDEWRDVARITLAATYEDGV